MVSKEESSYSYTHTRQLAYNYICTVEVHYCVVMMQWKLTSSEHSISFNWVQNGSIRGSSSAVIQNLGEHSITTFNVALCGAPKGSILCLC